MDGPKVFPFSSFENPNMDSNAKNISKSIDNTNYFNKYRETPDESYDDVNFFISNVTIPEQSPFINEKIVIFKDSFKGNLPLNGLFEKDLKEAEEIYHLICTGNSFIQIDESDSHFKTIVEHSFLKILTRKIGIDLVKFILSAKEKLLILKGTDSKLIFEKKILELNTQNFYYFTSDKFGNKKKILYSDLSFTLFHELVHFFNTFKGEDNLSKKPTLSKEFDDLEEQLVIFGLKEPLTFEEPTDLHFNDEILIPYDRLDIWNPINENVFLTSFQNPFRVDHRGGIMNFKSALESGDFNDLKNLVRHELELSIKYQLPPDKFLALIIKEIDFYIISPDNFIELLLFIEGSGIDLKQSFFVDCYKTNILMEAYQRGAGKKIINFLTLKGLNFF